MRETREADQGRMTDRHGPPEGRIPVSRRTEPWRAEDGKKTIRDIRRTDPGQRADRVLAAGRQEKETKPGKPAGAGTQKCIREVIGNREEGRCPEKSSGRRRKGAD